MSRIISAKFTREQGSVTLGLMEPGQEPRRRRWCRASMTQPTVIARPTYGRLPCTASSTTADMGRITRVTVFDFPELKSSEAKLDYPGVHRPRR
ncbi:MAG: hypothetical protein CM1200mP34_2640 [Verrucomicrobiales bacterium]|nr:MAG: hypothetical protein CM1200mP34_2640 [Verrucomicrobiales bacterium]